MNPTLRISKVIRTLGLMGIMLALAGLVANTPSASAGRIKPADSRVVVYPIFPSTETQATAAIMVYDSNGYPVAKGTASNEESFVATLAPGGYTVSVFADGYADYNEIVKLDGGQSVTVKAPLSATAPVPMMAYGQVVVRAIFPPTAGDATSADVVISDMDGTAISKGTADSQSDFTVDLAPGTYRVTLYAQGYNDYNEDIEVASSDTVTVKAALTPLVLDGTIVVTVIVPPTNLEYGPAEVRIRDENNNLVADGIVDRDQNFVATLAPGRYTITASAQGYNEYTEAVEVISGETAAIEAFLTR
ncbi:MAG TPA: carboxypeptidase regulatory-like domain-containing protein [Chloroflexia bacterium]|nr:carboxypeptidase regulatory-like domain-containing protein [Chloroflexia bacterium]